MVGNLSCSQISHDHILKAERATQ
uniref:Uncharacterized protein n=1 Tax=Arundo donax TaxID=35708 RepID=A0A0A9AEA6_ARUDO